MRPEQRGLGILIERPRQTQYLTSRSNRQTKEIEVRQTDKGERERSDRQERERSDRRTRERDQTYRKRDHTER